MWRARLTLLLLVMIPPALAAQSPVSKKDVLSLSKRIDALIAERAKKEGVALAPPADPATFFRRLNIDLVGKIPDVSVARDYVDDDRPEKNWEWVETLLTEPEDHTSKGYGSMHNRHFAAVWRSILLPSTNQQAIAYQPGFEMYLKDRLNARVSHKAIVREILTNPYRGNPGMMGASSQGFFLANENKAENLAAATSRVFLGIKLDCAQCHSHPFASWTREQFWEFAAFFSGQTQNVRFMSNMPSAGTPREIKIPGTEKVVKAKFLDGQEPPEGANALELVADWITSPKNPYFAKATADHIWSYFFGISLLEPILEQANDDVVIHSELLDLLAAELSEHGFDTQYLMRAIVLTDAYRRSSEGKGGPKETQYFARMTIRGMTPEQFFDSFAEATAYKEDPVLRSMGRPQFFNPNVPLSPRQEFLQKFQSGERRHETQTSIQQALYLMNSKFVQERTRVESNDALRTIVFGDKEPVKKRLETLFLMTLSRLPRAEERERLEKHLGEGIAKGEAARAWSDVFWALLNSAEFRLNH